MKLRSKSTTRHVHHQTLQILPTLQYTENITFLKIHFLLKFSVFSPFFLSRNHNNLCTPYRLLPCHKKNEPHIYKYSLHEFRKRMWHSEIHFRHRLGESLIFYHEEFMSLRDIIFRNLRNFDH